MDQIDDIVLFASRHSARSKDVVSEINRRQIDIQIVYLDTQKARKRVMENLDYKITHVPTLFIVYKDQTGSTFEGVDACLHILKRIYPEMILETHQDVKFHVDTNPHTDLHDKIDQTESKHIEPSSYNVYETSLLLDRDMVCKRPSPSSRPNPTIEEPRHELASSPVSVQDAMLNANTELNYN